jgi:CRP-like cAMP-binding protein
MSLLTGAPQRTTIRAKTETVICEITSDALHKLFERKPSIMKKIAKNITEWQREEDDAITAIAQSRRREAAQIMEHTNSLSDHIIKFFNLQKE